MTDREILEDLYRAAVAAVDPGPATASALDSLLGTTGNSADPVWIIALGKAAVPMARAAIDVARARGLTIAGGVIVAPAPSVSPHPRVSVVVGDHPEPGAGSLAAADAIASLTRRLAPADRAWVLLSGGATSLVGAPLDGISADDLRQLYHLLLGSGLDISAMNLVRKRFTRWGGGKLAAALAPARVDQLIVSDVIGDDLPSIGSGPCVPDPATASQVREVLESAGLWPALPASLRALVTETERGARPETPKAEHQAFASITSRVVSSNRLALQAAAVRAAELGLVPEVVTAPLEGEASRAGTSVTATLRNYSQAPGTQGPARRCVIWGGETTVTLGDHPGEGGRSQELALSAAQTLAGTTGISVLAAGTDGRDGPTDAAGAIVDGATWDRIRAAGGDPGRDLANHNAYPALATAGALFRPGLTGTNVMDIVVGLAG